MRTNSKSFLAVIIIPMFMMNEVTGILLFIVISNIWSEF